MKFRIAHRASGTRRGSSRWRRAFLALMIVVLAFGAITLRLFVWPAQGMPPSVSAIVVLAGRVTASIQHLSWRNGIARPC